MRITKFIALFIVISVFIAQPSDARVNVNNSSSITKLSSISVKNSNSNLIHFNGTAVNLTINANPVDAQISNTTWWLPNELPDSEIALFNFSSSVVISYNITTNDTIIASNTFGPGWVSENVSTSLWPSAFSKVNFTISIQYENGDLQSKFIDVITSDNDQPIIIDKPPAHLEMKTGIFYNFTWLCSDTSGIGTYTIYNVNNIAQTGVWKNNVPITYKFKGNIEKNVVIAIALYDLFGNKTSDLIELSIGNYSDNPYWERSSTVSAFFSLLPYCIAILLVSASSRSKKFRYFSLCRI